MKYGLDPPSYITSGNDLAFPIPNQTQEGQELGTEADNGFWRLVWPTWIYHSNATIVCGEGKGISAWRKGASMDPASGIVQVLATHGIEGEAFPPYATLWSFINPFDEAGEDPGVRIRRSSPQ